jgi:hypothetical protein
VPIEQPRYRLTFRALPGEVPAIIRVRKLAKLMLRGLGLRIEELQELPAESEAASQDAPALPGR